MFEMKFWVLCVAFLLTGCGSLATDRMFNDNLLDVAPKGDFDVRYPEWGMAPQLNTAGVQGPLKQVRTSSYEALRQFLLNNGIDHEIMPGDYPMIKLKNTIKFDTGSAKVSVQSKQWLDRMAQFLASESGIDIVLEGHTDNTGAQKFNDTLSEKRASSVKTALVQRQVAQNAIYTRGYGEHVPACTNKTKNGRACNRRVEVRFILSSN
ncbi:protein F-related protein [Vibrio mimicus SX-4]|uniref:OmpA family protein n=2 Tax=Vibrio mimicus TaxID=674 RepID=A0A2J9VK52_VIBMI|nr:protein F-related protein [Vibrio mimicus SX-4]PNM64158.1 OmpA family protein [Vibrio mimicus]